MLGLNRPIRDRRRSEIVVDQRSSSIRDRRRSEIVVDQAGHLAVCGRTDGRDVVVDGMLRRTAGKSVRYAGELVVPEPLDAVRRYLPFQDCQWQFSVPNFVPIAACSSWCPYVMASKWGSSS